MKSEFRNLKGKNMKTRIFENKWDSGKLSDVCELITDGSHFSPKEDPEGTMIIATVKDMLYDEFNFERCKKISKNLFDELSKNGCSPQNHDILISKDGANCLDLIFVYDSIRKIVLLSSIAIIRIKKKYDPWFFRYFLLAPHTQKIMKEGYVSGSAIPRVVLKDFKSVPIKIPPTKIQIKISTILRNLDKNIKYLQKQNKILEQIAQAIFKSWFVNFDGVTEFEDSELGKIPKGWSVKHLSEIADVSSGKRPNKKNQSKTTEYTIPCYGASKIDSYVKKAIFEKPILLTGRVGTLGIIHRVYSPCFPTDNTLILLPKDGMFFEFIYFNLKQVDFLSYNRGTSQPLLTQTDLKNIIIIVPDLKLLRSFNNYVKQFFKKIVKNNSQVELLTQTRDTLLPKLMSGEIKV